MPLLEKAAPYWQAQGMGVEQGLGQILQWGYYLAQNPQDAIPQIAKLYGVDLGKLTKEQPYYTPEERRQQQLLSAQQERLEGMERMLSSQQYERTLDSIGSFRNATDADGNKLHPYFDELSERITYMYSSGEWSGDLNGAYERALWLTPEVRTKMMQSSQQSAVKDVVQQNTEAARRVQDKTKQRVRHTQSGSPRDNDLDDMPLEKLVAKLAREQEAAAG
jgi:hypothetical protein